MTYTVVSRLRVNGRNWFRLELLSPLITTMKKKQVSVFWFVFHDIMLSCKMRLVPHANEQWEISNTARNWCRQWTTTDLDWSRPAWQLSNLIWSNNQLHTWMTSHTDIRETDWMRDCWKPLSKTHSVIHYIWIFFCVCVYSKHIGCEHLHESWDWEWFILH